MTETMFCGDCGAAIPATARFCRSCGAPQEPLGTPAAAAQPAGEEKPPAATQQAGGETPTVTAQHPAETPPAAAGAPQVAAASSPAAGGTQSAAEPPAAAPSAPAAAGAAPAAGANPWAAAESLAPGAGELASQLAGQLRTPGVAAAGISGLVGFAATIAAGLLAAALTSLGNTFVGFDAFAFSLLSDETGFLTQVFIHATQVVGASFSLGGDNGQSMPVATVAIPVAAIALGAYFQSSRIQELAPWARLAWGAASAVPFALLMLIPAIAGQTSDDLGIETRVGPTFGLALLWGVIGGTTGAVLAIRRQTPELAPGLVPNAARPFLRVAAVAARPLVIAIALCAVVGTAIVAVQTLRDAGGIVADRSKPGALVENLLYAGEHGIHLSALGTLSPFQSPVFPESTTGASWLAPIPVTKYERLFDDETYRVFAYSDAVPAWLFIPGIVLIIAIPALLALYGGFAAARVAGTSSPGAGAAWGAAVGPVWALLLTVANALANKTEETPLWGTAQLGGVFGMTLLFGAALGAVGGLLAVQSLRAAGRPTGGAA